MSHRPLGDADVPPTIEYGNRVEFVGGPRDGRSADLDMLPESIDVEGGQYQRSVRCAEDGAMRYVWRGDGGDEGRT